MTSRSSLSILGTAAALVCAAPAGAVTFADSSFSLAGYTIAGPITTGVELTLEQCAACGPANDAALRVAAVYPGLTGNYRAVLLNPAWTYDPATQGALQSVDASVDKRVILNFDLPAGLGNFFRPLVQQGGQLYAAALPGPSVFLADEGWKSIAGNLTAASFQLYDFSSGSFGSGAPDFSGGPLTFGLLQVGSRNSPFPDSRIEADYDNLVLTLNAVPEPGAALLMVVGLLGLLGRAARARQASAARPA